jgi:SAM-dependent methyltransferase
MALRKWTDHETCRWLQTPLGEALLTLEGRLAEDVLNGVFGEETLQLGLWGESRPFVRFTRTQRAAVLTDSLPENMAAGAHIAIGEYHRLPVASDSIDSVILPHTLDFSDRPHAILREVHRVLRADGHLLLMGFRPGGLWGLRRLIPGAAPARHADSALEGLFLPLAAVGEPAGVPFEMGRAWPALVVRIIGLLHADRAKAHQHTNAGATGLDEKAEGRRRPRRALDPHISNPI